MENELLQIKQVSKTFPGVKALDDVSVNIRAGTIHSLMGENGAGKSTLMKCLFGIYSADSGEFYLEGKKISFANSKQALEHGVSMVHQELNQVHTRSVMENIWLGRFSMGLTGINHKKMYQDTLAIFKDLNISIDPKAIIRTLSVSQRQMVEIAKAVSYDSKIIVFDEPTSSLSDVEVEHLFRIIYKLRDRGCGIIYISHKMNEILTISDDVTVLRDGKHVSTTKASELTIDMIIKQMVGRDLSNVYPPKDNTAGEVLLKVEGLSALYQNLKDVNFELRSGEILGVAGLVGAGRTEMVETIFGLATKKTGKLIKKGTEITNKNPRQAKRNGFALLTEERRATGIFGVLNIRENTTIANIKNYMVKKCYLNTKKMSEDTMWSIDRFRVKTPNQHVKINTLSGGNQQKVIIGRWVLTNPDIYLFDEPTRGIDVAAKVEIYGIINKLKQNGIAVMFVSSEMPEVLGISDRVIVMCDGRITGDVQTKETSQNEILTYATSFETKS